MRKYVLVAALVLVSATAQAGATRGPNLGLNLASNDEPAATTVPAPSSACAAGAMGRPSTWPGFRRSFPPPSSPSRIGGSIRTPGSIP